MKVSDAILIIGTLLIVLSFYRAHRNPAFDFDLFDLIMENGKVSKAAVVFMGSFAATTWIMIRLTLDGELTEGYFAGYGAIWVAPVVTRFLTHPPPPKDPG